MDYPVCIRRNINDSQSGTLVYISISMPVKNMKDIEPPNSEIITAVAV